MLQIGIALCSAHAHMQAHRWKQTKEQTKWQHREQHFENRDFNTGALKQNKFAQNGGSCLPS